MHALAKGSKATQPVPSAKSAELSSALPGRTPEPHQVLHPRHAIGQEKVGRSGRDAAEEPPVGSVAGISNRTGHDFGQIAVHSGPQAEGQPIPRVVRDVLASPGRPVDAATRAFFEPRFGRGFGHVRVHDDARSSASARSVDAPAYTVGSHVVFGAQADRPDSELARHVIAHEFAHVIQQCGSGSGGNTPIVDRISRPDDRSEAEADGAAACVLRGEKPMLGGGSTATGLQRAPATAAVAPARPFHQEAIDALAAERRQIITIVRSQIIPESVPLLEKLVALCEAIDRGAVPETKSRLEEFLAANTDRLPLATPSNALVAEMSSRMILLGLDAESERLRRWGVNREKSISPGFNRGYSREIFTWEALLERLLGRIPETGGAGALKALDGLLLLLGQLLRERFSLSAAEIEKDAAKRAAALDNYFIQRDQTISVYAAELVRLMREAFEGIQSAYQVVLDQAVDDLAAGRGGAMLATAKDRLESRLLPLIEPADKSRHAGGVAVKTTRSEFKKGGGVHFDALARTQAARAKRSVKVQFYDLEQLPELASEMSSDFAGVFLARRRQIHLIEEIYGLQKDDRGNLTSETKENAAAIATLGTAGLRLHNDDDWRRFVVAKFEQHEAVEGREKALVAVMGLLERYLRVFTTHTPYNIEDFGDNLLTRTFPRDLAGRLIHDCGVYALRMAYILSLMRDHPRLRLRFRYTVMPVHVGLLITGDGLPTFLVNNDSIVRYPAADVASMRGEWNQLDEEGEKGAPAKSGTEPRFSGELMADAFMSGVDLPYKQVDVVRAQGSPAALKAQLWQQYTLSVAPAADRLFGPSTKDPKSPNYQFYLRYLKLLGLIKEHYNTSLLPFWNVKAAGLWNTHKPAITSAFAALQTAAPVGKAAAQAAYDSKVKPYTDALDAELNLVQQAAHPIRAEQMAIQTHIGEHPEVFSAGTEVASADRLRATFQALGSMGEWWENVVYRHMLDLQNGTSVEAPFGKPENKLLPIN